MVMAMGAANNNITRNRQHFSLTHSARSYFPIPVPAAAAAAAALAARPREKHSSSQPAPTGYYLFFLLQLHIPTYST